MSGIGMTNSQFSNVLQGHGSSDDDANVSEEESRVGFDPQAIIDMAFDPKARLKPSQSVTAASSRPRKPRESPVRVERLKTES